MRALVLMLLCGTAAACGDDAGTFDYPLDDVLHLNHIQAKGSHNSYHVAMRTDFAPWRYTHAPIGEQLERQGVRHLELDVYFFDNQFLGEPPYFEVHHILGADEATTCARLKDCLGAVAAWSTAHPAHQPLLVLLEPKDEFLAARATSFFDVLEKEILAVFPRDRLLVPATVQGASGTMREAITTRGWPTLGALRGRVFFVLLDSGPHRAAYLARPDHLVFMLGGPADPDGALMLIDDPVVNFDAIRAGVEQGFLVRTRADTDSVEPLAGDRARLERALESGAQFISTDYPAMVPDVPYVFDIPDGKPSRCDPITAPTGCTPTAVEDPDFL